jgi:hypothetical protein
MSAILFNSLSTCQLFCSLYLWQWWRSSGLRLPFSIAGHHYVRSSLFCVTPQKSEDLIYTATEAWNHTSLRTCKTEFMSTQQKCVKTGLNRVNCNYTSQQGGITSCFSVKWLGRSPALITRLWRVNEPQIDSSTQQSKTLCFLKNQQNFRKLRQEPCRLALSASGPRYVHSYHKCSCFHLWLQTERTVSVTNLINNAQNLHVPSLTNTCPAWQTRAHDTKQVGGEEVSVPAGSRSTVFQPVAVQCMDWSVPDHFQRN